MDAIAGLTFRNPAVLWWTAAALAALAFLLRREKLRRELADRFVSERLRGVSNRLRLARPAFLSVGAALAIIAIAGPRAGSITMEVELPTRQRVIVLDVSNSMDATDAGASRLESGKAIARALLEAPEITRGALVIFEKSAAVLSPLSPDTHAIATLLDSVEAGELAEAGSDLGAGVTAATGLLKKTPSLGSDIILISDGEEQGTTLDAAIREAKTNSILVHGVMVGGRAPATIPTHTGLLETEEGETVQTTASPDSLQYAANETGGVFLDNPSLTTAVRRTTSSISGETLLSGEVRVPIERFQWPLAAAVFLLLLGGFANRGAD